MSEILPPIDQDEVFFGQHPRRTMRIRLPEPGRRRDETEFEKEFRTLGLHSIKRRRIIVAKVAPHMAHLHGLPFMKIPFLAFADEEIADTDEVLRPIFDGIMKNAAASYGMPIKRR